MASLQRKGLQAKILTSEEKEKLKSEQALVSGFKQQKLENEAQKNWDLFYKRNSTNFFKDRHWTTREFEELKSCREFEGQKLTILEAGCGVGNCLFPLLEEDLSIFAYACDFSPRAVEYVKQNPLYNLERCKVFQCDLTKDDLLDHVPRESVDIVMLIFVLSAVHPDKMHLVLQNIYKVLKPGKSVLFRDYGLYDHTMLRFKASSKLGENFYVRQDGTRSYFFTEEFLAQLFVGTGYEEVVNEYVFRETVNKKEGLCVPRVFLQSKFRKPPRDLSPATLYHQSLQNNFFQDYVQVIEAALTSQPLFKKAHLIPVLGRRRIGITTRVVLDANILSLHCCLNYTHTVSIFIVIVEEGKYLLQMHFLGQLQLRSIFDYCRYKKVRVLLPNM